MDFNALLRRATPILIIACGLSGCANLQTISRTTSTSYGSNKGRAVHLDAQQRLVVFAAQKYCAEPSPDALAAYASALGLSGSKLPSDSIAASGALSSMAGSIGLRTQSITLMRDTLYRICESAMNGNLSDAQVAVLMARSQDLTVVILAIEQLTGAVAAPPITLSGGGTASAAATLQANTEALKTAREAEARAKKERDDAEVAKNEAETAYNDAKSETANRRKASEAAPDDADKTRLLNEQLVEEKRKQQSYQDALSTFTLKDNSYKMQKETADQIAALRDASSNSSTAGVTGTARAGEAVVYRGAAISDTSATKVSETVNTLVTALLKKSYFEDACLAIMMQPSKTNEIAYQLQSLSAQQSGDNARADANRLTAAASDLALSNSELRKSCLDYFQALGVKAAK